MTVTPLALLKSQLNLDHDLDDFLLQHKLAVAEEFVGSYTGTPFADHDPVPASLIEAALQLASFWYGQREAVAADRLTAVPFGVLELLNPYREAVTGHVNE